MCQPNGEKPKLNPQWLLFYHQCNANSSSFWNSGCRLVSYKKETQTKNTTLSNPEHTYGLHCSTRITGTEKGRGDAVKLPAKTDGSSAISTVFSRTSNETIKEYASALISSWPWKRWYISDWARAIMQKSLSFTACMHAILIFRSLVLNYALPNFK